MRRFPHAQAKILTSVNATRERTISPTIKELRKSTEIAGETGKHWGNWGKKKSEIVGENHMQSKMSNF